MQRNRNRGAQNSFPQNTLKTCFRAIKIAFKAQQCILKCSIKSLFFGTVLGQLKHLIFRAFLFIYFFHEKAAGCYLYVHENVRFSYSSFRAIFAENSGALSYE